MRKSESNYGVRRQRLLSDFNHVPKSRSGSRSVGKDKFALFTLIALLAFGLLQSEPLRAQSQTQAASAAVPTLEFEVATIKPNKTDIPPGALTTDNGIDFRNVPLGILLGVAFGVSADRILAGPEWLSDRYDINAKMAADVADALKKLNPIDRRTARQRMLQALLTERCKMVFHRDTKELPVYLMVPAKGGPKLHEAKPADGSPDGVVSTGNLQFGQGGLITFQAMPLSSFIQILSQQVGRTVIDKTGLTGRYDFTWQFNQGGNSGAGRGGPQSAAGGAPAGASPAPSISTSADAEPPSIFTVLQEELGLKLDSGKGPVEVIVIDRIERPSGN